MQLLDSQMPTNFEYMVDRSSFHYSSAFALTLCPKRTCYTKRVDVSERISPTNSDADRTSQRHWNGPSASHLTVQVEIRYPSIDDSSLRARSMSLSASAASFASDASRTSDEVAWTFPFVLQWVSLTWCSRRFRSPSLPLPPRSLHVQRRGRPRSAWRTAICCIFVYRRLNGLVTKCPLGLVVWFVFREQSWPGRGRAFDSRSGPSF